MPQELKKNYTEQIKKVLAALNHIRQKTANCRIDLLNMDKMSVIKSERGKNLLVVDNYKKKVMYS